MKTQKILCIVVDVLVPGSSAYKSCLVRLGGVFVLVEDNNVDIKNIDKVLRSLISRFVKLCFKQESSLNPH